MRQIAEKERVIISGMREEHNGNWIAREKDEKERIDDILNKTANITESLGVRSGGGSGIEKVRRRKE